jgi:hypothetical protein
MISEILVLIRDRHKNVTGLNRIKQPCTHLLLLSTGKIQSYNGVLFFNISKVKNDQIRYY